MIKKLLATTLAAAMALSVSVPSFAAAASTTAADQTMNITTISGQPVYDTGVQVSATPAVGTPGGTIEPNQAIYYALPTSLANWVSSASNFRLSSRKITNGKLIKSIKLVEKRLTASSTTINVPTIANPIAATAGNYEIINGNTRHTYLEVVLNDTTSADEFKVEFSATLTARKAPSAAGALYYGTKTSLTSAQIADADTHSFATLGVNNKITLTGAVYVSNKVDAGSSDVTVGSKGLTVKPVGNEDNEVVFENEETLATMRFRANSNPAKFYAKLSTKWTTALLSKFQNTDAVVRIFTPATIDATSRATLLLNNPFDDSVNVKNIYIYAVNSKGVITDVTKSFTYSEDEDAFSTRTRTLGTWVISDVKVKLK